MAFVYEIEDCDLPCGGDHEMKMMPCPPRRRQSVPNIKIEGNRTRLMRQMDEITENRPFTHRGSPESLDGAPGVPAPPSKPQAVQRRPLGAVSHVKRPDAPPGRKPQANFQVFCCAVSMRSQVVRLTLFASKNARPTMRGPTSSRRPGTSWTGSPWTRSARPG